MSENIGFSAQAPSLPQGGGAVCGLGETFTPDLSTGAGTFAVRLDCPNGPNDIGPRLTLQYSTAAGNGPFGLGFGIALPRLLRSTATGYPTFGSTDALMLEGAGELLALPDGSLRPQVDAAAWRVVRSGSGFRATDREGLYYFLGTQPPAQLSDPANATRVFAWHLERIEDALGNAVVFTWMRDGAQLCLSSMAYGAYEVRFQYESRPDIVHWSRCGFAIRTAKRCSAIELHLPADANTLVRRWALQYVQADPNACSLLTGIVLSGFDASGAQVDAPPLTLSYSTFAPRDLMRFDDEGVTPGPLARSDRRVELMDWDGNGLPGLLEIAGGGNARFWPNVGECKWGRPRTLASLPLFSSPNATVAFADMDGDGFADLVRTDGFIAGYVPRLPGEGFARPVSWTQVPSIPASAPNSRMVDLDGDGIPDLIASRDELLELYYRRDPDGWSPRPQLVSRGDGPDVSFDDPHVSIADMTGDGSQDIVRVDGGGVVYWPYLGNGKWGDPVRMANPPELPFDLSPERLFVSDVDGDGCADLIYLDQDRVLHWINQSGNAFSAPHVIEFVPTGQIALPRIADMRGSGAAGLLWSVAGPLGRDASYFYLDFCNDSKPYLLTGVDNGVGSRSKIAYTTSAREAAIDALKGVPWATTLPVVIPVVASCATTDAATGRVTSSAYHYHDGRYDGILREFAGFGRVDQDDFGDASIPTLRTTSWFHNGVDPVQPQASMTMATRRQLRAIRGRLYRQERFGLDASAMQSLPYDRLEQQWSVDSAATAAGAVDIPRLVKTVRSTFERTNAAVATLTTVNSAWDQNFNVTDSTQTSAAAADPVQTTSLRTVLQYARDPAGRFMSRVWRAQQFDGTGAKIADTISEYDHAPEGTAAAQGLVTRKTSLVLSDALAAEVYGPDQPDFVALGYFRRAGEDGWWIDQARYERIDDAQGLRGTVTGPLGAKTTFAFDADKTFPVWVTDPRGNTMSAEYDYRACRVKKLTDAGGAESLATFDALARPASAIDPLDTAAAPTVLYSYSTTQLPVEATLKRRALAGHAQTVDSRELYDGGGRLLERRVKDNGGEIVATGCLYNARGLQAKAFLERRPTAATYAVPPDSLLHVAYFYDPLGRPVRQVNADGSVRTLQYGPLSIEELDEEDNRGGGAHANTSTVKRLDPTGRVQSIEQRIGARAILSSYVYDVKGNVVAHTDANGVTVRSSYDFMSRLIRVDRPERSTRSVVDAAGNAVEARSASATLVVREFDVCNRPVAVRYESAANAPVIQLVYHDQGAAAPPDAGTHTIGGRLVRIDDEGGTTIFDYDERGRMALKRSRPNGYARTLDLNFTYRSDDQVATIEYPDNGAGRRTLSYEYDLRGSIASVPGVIDAIEYDVAGSRTRVATANGVAQTFGYDAATRRLNAIAINGSAGTLRSTTYTWDLVGNLVAIGSPNPKLASTFAFDDLYRLTAASTGSGRSWSYAYDDGGNITSKSDMGDYRYGESGAPATCLTSAGTGTFTYTELGDVKDSPWGTHTFNPMGRLTRIVRPAGAGQMDFVYDYAGTRVCAKSSDGIAPAVDMLTPDPLYAIEAGELVVNVFDGRGIAARLRDGAQPVYMHADHLGGLALVTDQSGKVFDELIYDPYGQVLERTTDADMSIGFTGGAPDAWSGLLFLQARYYHPALGRFISPDAIVQDIYDPASWAPYCYCSNNPVSIVDPTGRGGWAIAIAALAIAALIVLSIVTLGVGAFIAVGIGLAAGGIIGGITAAQHGGDATDIWTGVLVGAAVGGWAAYGGLYAGGFVASHLGLASSSFLGSVVAGGINGAINGAAIGFAAGYAGGKGDDVWSKTWQGALAGLVTGAVLGGVAHALSDGSTKSPLDEVKKGLSEKPPPAGPQLPPGSIQSPTDPTVVNNLSGAGQTVGTKLATKVATPYVVVALRWLLTGPGAPATFTLLTDAAAGAWDLGYVQDLLRKAGLRV